MNLEIIKGQTSATVDYVHESLKPYPVFAVCTNSNCRFIGPTKVNKTMNVLNCLFCYFFVGCWFVFNQLKRKEFSCYDSDHHCLKCGTKIGNYESC